MNVKIFFLNFVLLLNLSSLNCNKKPIKQNHEFKYSTILDHDNRVRLEWTDTLEANSKNEKFIAFKIIVISRRLPIIVGFGMSDRGKFENADFIVIEIKSEDEPVTTYDSYTDKNGVLHKDNEKSSYEYLNFDISQDEIEIYFIRKIDTCDPQDFKIEPGTIPLIHFLLKKNSIFDKTRSINSLYDGSFKPDRDADSYDMKHSQLLRSTYYENIQTEFDQQKENHKYFDVLNQRAKIPPKDTTYWCKVYKLDNVFQKRRHHVIGFESIITPSSQGIVHHMELFHCVTDPSDKMKNYDGPCNSEEKPEGKFLFYSFGS
jgi:dopamine beta-monooxygenase